MKTYLVRGVPASIQLDSWWMDGAPPRPPAGKTGQKMHRNWAAPVALAGLISLADFLLWQVMPGLSLPVFGFCLLLAGLGATGGRGWGGVILGGVLFLPVIEQVQVLSLLFWLAGIILGGAWLALGGWPGTRQLTSGAIRLLALGPLHALRDMGGLLAFGRKGLPATDRMQGLVLGWALPLGLGLIFLSLLLEANPVIEDWLRRLDRMGLPDMSRIFFWAGMALVIWPFVFLPGLRGQLLAKTRSVLIGPRQLPRILNDRAVRRSLFLFNLLFAVQTVMDATFLWGGAALPHGMNYAEYAHRGAYPLLVTALLAGLFALVARPYTGNDALVRLALLAFVAQNVLLVGSSLLRLELYVEAYGLTRLRMAAAIWMGLVAVWLAMILWQIVNRQSAGWLLARSLVLGLTLIYACMFVSFDRTIARYNLSHDVPLDAWYICNLGPAALPEILAYERQKARSLCVSGYPYLRKIDDWREWGFRDWRVFRSLGVMQSTGAAP